MPNTTDHARGVLHLTGPMEASKKMEGPGEPLAGPLDEKALAEACRVGANEAREYGVPEPNDSIFLAAIRAYIAATPNAAPVVRALSFGWKCNNCGTVFTSSLEARTGGKHDGGAKCPYCKAHGQYTYRYELHEGDPCVHCGEAHDNVSAGPCHPVADTAALDALRRLRENLDSFDAEVAYHLETEAERADLWTELDVNANDLRTVLAVLSHPAVAKEDEKLPCDVQIPGALDALREADEFMSNFLESDDFRWKKVRAAIAALSHPAVAKGGA